MGSGCFALGLWEELLCYAIVSLMVVWLVPGMWAIVLICADFQWFSVSG